MSKDIRSTEIRGTCIAFVAIDVRSREDVEQKHPFSSSCVSKDGYDNVPESRDKFSIEVCAQAEFEAHVVLFQRRWSLGTGY